MPPEMRKYSIKKNSSKWSSSFLKSGFFPKKKYFARDGGKGCKTEIYSLRNATTTTKLCDSFQLFDRHLINEHFIFRCTIATIFFIFSFCFLMFHHFSSGQIQFVINRKQSSFQFIFDFHWKFQFHSFIVVFVADLAFQLNYVFAHIQSYHHHQKLGSRYKQYLSDFGISSTK